MADAVYSDLEGQFESAAEHLESLVGSLDDNQKLHFYARFKQAKEGPCNIPKPSFLNFTAKRKWSSWKELGEMSREQAMQEYIDGILLIDPQWDESDKSDSRKPLSIGLTVSTLKPNPEDLIDDDDKTVFDWVKEGCIERVKKLLENGSCNSNEFDDEGMNLLHWACDRGHYDVVELLLQQGANVNLKDSEGQTPLHYASSCGHISTIEILFKYGADSKLLDNDGLNPHDVACDPNVAALVNR